MKSRVRVAIKRLLKYSILGVLCLFVEVILRSLDVLSILNCDILYVTIKGSLNFGEYIVIIVLLLVMFSKNISSLHIWIKKHRVYLALSIFLGEIVFLYKCNTKYQIIQCLIEFGTLLFLLEYETSKIFNYNFTVTSKEALSYVEKPVIGRTNLTSSQCNALDQLKKIIGKRSSSDSFNIALIGAWGRGKTSITDTLIYEYEKESNEYFILKIGTLTIKETKNVVVYVKNYFEDLFRKYEIGIAGRNVAFLTSLASLFSDKFSTVNILSATKDNGFFDIEKEKELFTKQVSKLLKVSGRKNVIFVIDDTDRNDDEEQIIKLLSEFASIAGIISIISLDAGKDVVIRPNNLNTKTEQVYNQIDKYIHIRVRIDDDNHIEYDSNITSQIISSFENIVRTEKCFISCDGQNEKKSLFDNVKDYQTTEILNPRNYAENTYNILTEIFFENLRYNKKEFGLYLEELVNEYIYNSKELNPYIREMIETPYDKWETELIIVNAQWTNSFGLDGFDWVMRLRSNSEMLYWTLYQTVEALELINNTSDIKGEIRCVEDAYDYLMISRFSIDGRTWENRKEHPVTYSGFHQIKLIVFGETQYEILNQAISNGNFGSAKNLLLEKMEGVANLFLLSILLVDFMQYLRNVLNNYRTFKMQLREAELLNMNYLDYLIKEWQPREQVRDNIQKMKDEKPLLKNLNWGFPSLNAFVNNVQFENYILRFGNRFGNEQLKGSKLFLYHGEKTIIVISMNHDNSNPYILLDVSGNIVSDITEDELLEISEKNSVIESN